MPYTCDGPHPDPVPADMLITQLGDGDTQTLCQSCYLESCIRVAAAIADAMASEAPTAPVDDIAAEVRDDWGNGIPGAPQTAVAAREDEGAAQAPPPPKRGRARRQAAPTAAQDAGQEGSPLPGAEHDG